jgi:hypothetical protein
LLLAGELHKFFVRGHLRPKFTIFGDVRPGRRPVQPNPI